MKCSDIDIETIKDITKLTKEKNRKEKINLIENLKNEYLQVVIKDIYENANLGIDCVHIMFKDFKNDLENEKMLNLSIYESVMDYITTYLNNKGFYITRTYLFEFDEIEYIISWGD